MWDIEFQKRSRISHRISHIAHLLLWIFWWLVVTAWCLVHRKVLSANYWKDIVFDVLNYSFRICLGPLGNNWVGLLSWAQESGIST